MLTLIAFIVTLGILVTVHEYGHFQVARWCGVKVLKFSIGFGKPIWSKKAGPDQTEFIIAAIPLGGYVKMLGEEYIADGDPVHAQDMSRAFNRQSVIKKMAIVLAGPAANLLLAVLLYWGLFISGVVGLKPIVGAVLENSPAAESVMQSGELIKKVNGKDVTTWQDVRWLLLNASLNANGVTIETVDSRQQLHTHRLNTASLKNDQADIDVLQKLGLTVFQPKVTARIGEVLESSPAELAGLVRGDVVLAINGKNIDTWDALVEEVRQLPKQRITLMVQRGPNTLDIKLTPDAVSENGAVVGRIGAGVDIDQAQLDQYFITQHFSAFEALANSGQKTLETALFSLKMLGNMLIGNVSWKGMSGPVTIASYAGQSATLGLKAFVGFLALISISIGILNLLPIPILDGGHLMYYMIEFFTGKPVSETVVSIGQKIGLFILGWMMILALYNDMNRLITG